MALFSDIDWLVILAVAAFLFFGGQGQQFVRQLGRMYGRLLRFRNEMLSEFTSGELGGGRGRGLRETLLGDAPSGPTSVAAASTPAPGIAVRVAPVVLRSVETLSYGSALGPGTWSIAATSAPGEVVHLR